MEGGGGLLQMQNDIAKVGDDSRQTGCGRDGTGAEAGCVRGGEKKVRRRWTYPTATSESNSGPHVYSYKDQSKCRSRNGRREK